MIKRLSFLLVLLVASSVLASGFRNATPADGLTIGAEPPIAQMPYLLAVSQGLVDGASSVAKFGKNEATTTGDDIWAGTGPYNFYPTNALAVELVSTSTNDVDQGTGAWTILVQGLDADLYQIQELVTLNGTTAVPLTNTYRRVYRAIVLTCGALPTNAGDIEIREAGDGEIAGVVLANEGQTVQTPYTIPRGKTGYLYQTYAGLADDDKAGESVIFQIQTRLNNGHTGAWSLKGEVGSNSLGSSTWLQPIPIPGRIPEMTDIRVIAHQASATLGTFAGYTVLLIDN